MKKILYGRLDAFLSPLVTPENKTVNYYVLLLHVKRCTSYNANLRKLILLIFMFHCAVPRVDRNTTISYSLQSGINLFHPTIQTIERGFVIRLT